MKDLLRKGYLLGLGVAAITKQKVEQFAKEAVKKGAITEAEAKGMAKVMLVESAKAQKRLSKTIVVEAKKLRKKFQDLR